MADEVEPRTGELLTANYGWVKPTVGASLDAWGGYINTDLDGIDGTVKSVSNAIPAPSSTTPAMDGTATVGTGTTYARADHIHPTDTSRYAAANPSGYQTAAQVTAALPVASSTTPAMNGAAAVGTGTTWARADHVHPSDTSRLALAGGTMTGALTVSQTAGIVGTTAANNANAGAVGEFVRADQLTNVALTTAVNKNITTLSLTAGDWDVEGWVNFGFSTAGQIMCAALSTTSANVPATPYDGVNLFIATGQTVSAGTLPTGSLRVSLAATTTVYLVAQAGFTGGTCAAQGTIRARRVR
jgi:hypothetical protein